VRERERREKDLRKKGEEIAGDFAGSKYAEYVTECVTQAHDYKLPLGVLHHLRGGTQHSMTARERNE
jgi:hypothetical protein